MAVSSLPHARLTTALCALVLGACSSDEPRPDNCRAVPAFEVTVRALNGPLPPDTVLEVTYGAGVEEYRLGEPAGSAHDAVFCDENGSIPDAALSDAGDGGVSTSAVGSVSCKLWTNGFTQVKVTGDGYPELLADLEAERDECGVVTVTEELVLGEVDAGQ